MNKQHGRNDNAYADERGLHHPVDGFRDQNREIHTPSPRAPEPGAESVGPAMFKLVEETARAYAVQSQLILKAIPLLSYRTVVNYATGSTDGSGNLDLPLYTVPQGMQFRMTRFNLDNGGLSTPATPYTNPAGWIAIFRGDKISPGNIVDFLPNPGVASGAIIPAILSDGPNEAAIFRGGEKISFHMANGPANQDMWCRIQGNQEPV